ncbi:MAG: amidase [Parasphingorhabdus sp.]
MTAASHLSNEEAAILPQLMAELDAGLAPLAKRSRRISRDSTPYRPTESEQRQGWAWKGEIAISDDGPLKGLSFAVKDNIAAEGLPLTNGNLDRSPYWPDQHNSVVEQLLEAGARCFGKAQCEDFCQGGQSFSSLPYPVQNPHTPNRSAGGSSSGSAALVARGMVDFALGSDSAGSVRIPASHCGIVGLKPTRGTFRFDNAMSLEPFLETIGILARSVSETNFVFDALKPASRSASSRRPLRVARVQPSGSIIVADEIGERLNTIIERTFGEGIENIELDLAEANQAHLGIYMIGMAHRLRGLSQPFGSQDGHEPEAAAALAEWIADRDTHSSELALMLEAGERAYKRYGHAAYVEAIAIANRTTDHVNQLFKRFDVLILPTVASEPPVRPSSGDGLLAQVATSFSGTELTAPFSLTGHPAMSVPLNLESNLPVGAMIVAPYGREDLLFVAGKLMETNL